MANMVTFSRLSLFYHVTGLFSMDFTITAAGNMTCSLTDSVTRYLGDIERLNGKPHKGILWETSGSLCDHLSANARWPKAVGETRGGSHLSSMSDIAPVFGRLVRMIDYSFSAINAGIL